MNRIESMKRCVAAQISIANLIEVIQNMQSEIDTQHQEIADLKEHAFVAKPLLQHLAEAANETEESLPNPEKKNGDSIFMTGIPLTIGRAAREELRLI